jgi:protein-tyrosine-phosphatase
MAAAIMDKLASENNLDVRIESAGMFATDGEKATPEAIEAIRKYEIDLSSHLSSQITPELIEKSDLIITMTEAHKMVLQDMAKEKTCTLCELADISGDIDDPFGGDVEDYIEVADKLYIALTQLCNKIEEIEKNSETQG